MTITIRPHSASLASDESGVLVGWSYMIRIWVNNANIYYVYFQSLIQERTFCRMANNACCSRARERSRTSMDIKRNP